MGTSKHGFLIGFLLCLTLQTIAQEHRFAVYFSDKNNTPYSIDSPEEFLSDRAVARRAKQGIAITESDFPVNSNYVSQIAALGIEVSYTSKWMNAVLIEADSSYLSQLIALSFVSDIELAAPAQSGSSSGRRKFASNGRAKMEEATDFQNHILGIDSMHSQGFEGQGMLIGVFDGGFAGLPSIPAFQHLFDQDKIKGTYDFVGHSTDIYKYSDHGTRAVSLIGAFEENLFTGTAPQADFILSVTEDVAGEYRVEEYNWLFAAEWADSMGVDVISTSLGYNTFDFPAMDYTVADLDGNTTVISKAAALASGKGILIVVSAGNSGAQPWKFITAPADAQNILAVGAIAQDSTQAGFSSFGPTADGRIKPEVVALGVKTATIDQSGNVNLGQGTSFAAPQIAGLVAGYWQANPELNYLEVIERIKNSASQAIIPENTLGWGIPNFSSAQIVTAIPEPDHHRISVYPNPFQKDRVFIEGLEGMGLLTLKLFSSTGQLVWHKESYPLSTVEVNMPELAPGLYVLELHSKRLHKKVKLLKF